MKAKTIEAKLELLRNMSAHVGAFGPEIPFDPGVVCRHCQEEITEMIFARSNDQLLKLCCANCGAWHFSVDLANAPSVIESNLFSIAFRDWLEVEQPEWVFASIVLWSDSLAGLTH